MNTIEIVCDGSSLGNGTKGASTGSAAIILVGKSYKVVAEYLGCATNNQAEIVAACIGLEFLDSIYTSSNINKYIINIKTDSLYVVRTMIKEYRRKKNFEYWKRLDKAVGDKVIKWEWIRGHDGHRIQEMVDTVARSVANERVVGDSIIIQVERMLNGFQILN